MQSETFKHKKLLTIKEAGNLLGVSTRWIYHRLSDGSLPLVKIKGISRVSMADLEKLVEQGRRG